MTNNSAQYSTAQYVPTHPYRVATLQERSPFHLPAGSFPVSLPTCVLPRGPIRSACEQTRASYHPLDENESARVAPETPRNSSRRRSREKCSEMAARLRCRRSSWNRTRDLLLKA